MKRFSAFFLLFSILILSSCTQNRDVQHGFIPKAKVLTEFPNSATVQDVEIGSDGFIWIATGNEGLFHYNGSTYIQFKGSDKDGDIHSSVINVLHLCSDKTFLIGTGDGIYRYDTISRSFEQLPIDNDRPAVQRIIESQKGNLYAVTKYSICLFDREKESFNSVISLNDSYIAGIAIDSKDHIWVFSDRHCYEFDNNYNIVSSIETDMTLLNAASVGKDKILVRSYPQLLFFDMMEGTFEDVPESLFSLYKTTSFDFTYIGENNIMFYSHGQFRIFNTESNSVISGDSPEFPFASTETGIDAGRIFPLKSGEVWISPQHGTPQELIHTQDNPHIIFERFLKNHAIKNIVSDGNYIWFVNDNYFLSTYDISRRTISTVDISVLVRRYVNQWRDCRIFLDSASHRFFITVDSNTYEFSILQDGNLSPAAFYPANIVSSYITLTCDRQGRLWAGGESNVLGYAYPPDRGFALYQLTDIKIDSVPKQASVSTLLTLSNGDIAVGFTEVGAAIIDSDTLSDKIIDFGEGIRISRVTSLCEDERGNILIGTNGNGLFIYNPSTGIANFQNQFHNKRINNIIKSPSGSIFIVCDNSTLYAYSPQSDEFKAVLNGESNPETVNSLLFNLNDSNFIYLNGEIFALKDNFKESNENPMTGFDILVCNTDGEILEWLSYDTAGKQNKQVVLNKNENNLLAVFSFNRDKEIHYRYSCHSARNGKALIEVIDNPVISLKALPYGVNRLTFALHNSIHEERSSYFDANITVRRPWYFSNLAMTLYCLVVLLLLTILIISLKETNRKRIEAEIAKKHSELQETINHDNMDFFANISHEFRTPLTIISDATETLLKDRNMNLQEVRLLHAMQRNSRRMMRYVSQILDFNKAEHNKLTPCVSIADLSQIINGILDNFSHYAEQKRISLETNLHESVFTWIDEDFLSKIMYNILSNAFKFTPSCGSIKVCAEIIDNAQVLEEFGTQSATNGKHIRIRVTDTGIGIPDDKKALVFERFGKAESSKISEGTGIGLFFTKALIEAHHGIIKLEDNMTDGLKNGLVVSFALPMDRSAYSDIEVKTAEDKNKSLDSNKYLEEMPTLAITGKPDKKMQKVLVIDDDSEIIYYLKLILSPYFQVISSMDAMTGYNLIETEHPDIIVSDVMMLETDGIKLCRMVKENINISNIPFILLTAKTTKQDQIEGLNAGAEAYIAKPFDSDYLISVIRSILVNRSNVQKLLGENTRMDDKIKESAMSEKDRLFIEKIYQFMSDNIMDTELNADRIAAELQMSRTKFYYKIKSLTGQTPNEFFKKYKLNRAVELIRENKYKLSAISDMVGFSSPSHFANTFKKYFGVLPSKF